MSDAAPTTAPTTTATQATPTTEAGASLDTSASTSTESADRTAQVAETASEARRHKVTVDGEELEVDEAELLRGYSRTRAANKRFEEAAKTRKELEASRAEIASREREFTETIRMVRDPRTRAEAITRLLGGEDALAELATDVLVKRMEWEALPKEERERRSKMTEREKALVEEERKIEAREKALRERHEREVETRAKALQAEYTKIFPVALTKAGAPSTPAAVQRLARTMSDALEAGSPLTVDEAAQIVAEDIREEVRAISSGADPKTLRALLGDSAEKLRTAELDALRAQPGRSAPQPAKREEPPQLRASRERPLSTDDVRRMFRSR